MGVTGRIIAGSLAGLLALLGLFFSANAIDGGIYYSGLLIFVTMVSYIGYLVKRQIAEGEAAHRASAAGEVEAEGSRRS